AFSPGAAAGSSLALADLSFAELAPPSPIWLISAVRGAERVIERLTRGHVALGALRRRWSVVLRSVILLGERRHLRRGADRRRNIRRCRTGFCDGRHVCLLHELFPHFGRQ